MFLIKICLLNFSFSDLFKGECQMIYSTHEFLQDLLNYLQAVM